MDISNSYKSNNDLPLRSSVGGALGYDLNSEKQEIERITLEVKKELLAKWKKSYANAQTFPAAIASMHPDVLDFLLSFNLVYVYDDIAKQANLDMKGRNILPRIVWQVAQTKNWNGIDQILESQLPLLHSAHVSVVDLLKKNILDKARALSEKTFVAKAVAKEEQRKEMQLSLSDALLKYPKIGEQNITGNQIRLKYFPTPVRPSIKNWITDFHDTMGAGKHSPVDRGNFLFHSENGKILSAIERQKLAIILKSLDEQTSLSIDAEKQIILFNVQQDSVIENNANIADSKRQNNTDINLRPASNQQANEKEKISFSPNFTANRNAVVSNISNLDSFPTHLSSTTNVAVDANKKEEMFFEIPGSKPPIGSSDFHVAVDEKMKQSVNEFDRNIVSYDMPYDILQEKENNKIESIRDNVPIEGNVSFSSPQKLSAEQVVMQKNNFTNAQYQPSSQTTNFKQNIQQQSAPINNQSSNSVVQKNYRSPFNIVPADYAKEKEVMLAKRQKNIVDLKS
jgi:hypothetical protein